MNKRCACTTRVMALLLICLLSGFSWKGGEGSASAAETPVAPLAETTEDIGGEELSQVEPYPESLPIDTHLLVDAFAGYRFLSVNGNGGRAAEYEYLHSNPVLDGLVDYMTRDNKIVLEGGFLNDKDYNGEMTYDHRGIYRFKLRTESLFHNLNHEELFTPDFANFKNATYSAIDLNPVDRYGIRVEQDLAAFRYKLPFFPLHLNLAYWRMVKEENAQLRFADQDFEGTPNKIFSKTRAIDWQTHEGKFGFDSHLGFLEIIYDFRVREFENHNSITPRDNFIDRLAPGIAMERLLEHNENPESIFYSHTIRLHTSLSGGIVGAASYTYGRRENRSDLIDVKGADLTHDILHNVAGDLTYTPCGFFSVAVKYRRQAIDRENPALIGYVFAANQLVTVRPAIDTQRDAVTVALSYRPFTLLTFKGEYKGEFLSRDNLDSWNQPTTIGSLQLPLHTDRHSGTFSILSRPLKGLRLKAQYSYSTADNAEFGNAYGEKHEGALLVTYNAPNRWGVTANARISDESSDHLSISTLDLLATPLNYQFSRRRKATNTTMSLWYMPLQGLTLTGSYGFIRNAVDQGVLFSGPLAGSNTLANYTTQAQIYAVNAAYHVDNRVDLSLALQQVRGVSDFDPQLVALAGDMDTSGIRQISQLATVESSLSVRADYRLTRNYSCAVEYTFRDYDEKNSSLFDGRVNTVMLYMAGKW